MNIIQTCAVATVVLLGSIWFIVHFCFIRGRQIVAEQRASALLRGVLTACEYEHFLSKGYIDFPSPTYAKRVYRVRKAGSLVQVRENDYTIMHLCLQPVEQLPGSDIVVLHKLMIEADEETYLQTANQFVPLFTNLTGNSQFWVP